MKLKYVHMNLNIPYDAPDSVWEKVTIIYAQMDGWLGFGNGMGEGEEGIPYWFGFKENEKHINASSEPSGLSFNGRMEVEAWEEWKRKIKAVATEVFGYQVGEPELGEASIW